MSEWNVSYQKGVRLGGLAEVVDIILGEVDSQDVLYPQSKLKGLNLEDFIGEVLEQKELKGIKYALKFDYTYQSENTDTETGTVLEVTLSFEGTGGREYHLTKGIKDSQEYINGKDLKELKGVVLPIIKKHYKHIPMLSFRIDFKMNNLTLPYRSYLVTGEEEYLEHSITEILTYNTSQELDKTEVNVIY